uniref:AH domain-containing protein n=1 Tax=Caenorhabditis tropicalis TaxID=1561998 RepID=A0A1I7U0U5_9PELO
MERKKEKDESRQNDHIDRLIASNNMEARMRIAHKNVNKKIEERWASLRVDTTQLSDITQVINKTISVQHQGLIDEVRNAVAAIDKFGDEFKTIKYDFKLNLANFIKAHMDIVAEFRDDQVKMMRLHREDPQSFMDKYEAELRDEEMAKFFPGNKREMARNPSIANQTLESNSLEVSVSSQGILSQPVTHHIKQLDEAALVIDERERIFETDVARLNTLWEKVNNFVYAEHMKFIKESSTIMLLLEKYETNCLAHNAYKNQVLQHIKFFTDLHAHMVGNYFELSAEIITSQREKITRLANGDRTVLDEKEEPVMKNDSLPIDAIGVVDELISDIANHVKNSTHKETPDDYVHFLVSSSSRKVAETPGCSVFADQPSSSVTDKVTSMTDNQETNSKEQATTADRNAGNPDLNAVVSNGTRGKK